MEDTVIGVLSVSILVIMKIALAVGSQEFMDPLDIEAGMIFGKRFRI